MAYPLHPRAIMEKSGRKVVLITGATDGIGKAAAIELARANAKVIIHGRSMAKARRVEVEIQEAAGRTDSSVVIADFKSLGQVRKLARDIQRRYPRLDVLINNAGIFSRERTISEDSHEQTFQVNYLAPFLLTTSLVGLLARNAPARVINVSSLAHRRGALDFDDLENERRYSGLRAYANSKLALSMFTVELANRLAGTGVSVMHLHPGGASTKLLHAALGPVGIPTRLAGRTLARMSLEPPFESASGAYFTRPLFGLLAEREGKTHPDVSSERLRNRLWAATEEILSRESAEPDFESSAFGT